MGHLEFDEELCGVMRTLSPEKSEGGEVEDEESQTCYDVIGVAPGALWGWWL